MPQIEFKNDNGQMLSAQLDRPDGDVSAYALFAHCFTCSKNIFAASRIAKTLQAKNIAVLRFDFTGLGASEGDFANTNFSSNVSDLISAANYMRETLGPPALLIGHSLGGSAVLAAASAIPDSKAIVTLGSPSDVSHVAHHFEEALDEIEENGEAKIRLVGRPFTIKKQFIEDIRGARLETAVRELNKALLVMHAPLDQTVAIQNAATIFGWAKHPRSYVSLDDADHLLTRKEDAEYAASVLAAWAEKYL